MQKLLVAISILLVVVVGGKAAVDKIAEVRAAANAQERVRLMLEGTKKDGARARSFALWQEGAYMLSGGKLAAAATAFEGWLRQKGLPQFVSEYEVGEAVVEQEAGPLEGAVVLVVVTIEGQPFKLRVQDAVPIAWAD